MPWKPPASSSRQPAEIPRVAELRNHNASPLNRFSTPGISAALRASSNYSPADPHLHPRPSAIPASANPPHGRSPLGAPATADRHAPRPKEHSYDRMKRLMQMQREGTAGQSEPLRVVEPQHRDEASPAHAPAQTPTPTGVDQAADPNNSSSPNAAGQSQATTAAPQLVPVPAANDVRLPETPTPNPANVPSAGSNGTGSSQHAGKKRKAPSSSADEPSTSPGAAESNTRPAPPSQAPVAPGEGSTSESATPAEGDGPVRKIDPSKLPAPRSGLGKRASRDDDEEKDSEDEAQRSKRVHRRS